MHGSILHGFKQFVIGRHGPVIWQAVSKIADGSGWYYSSRVYPDAEFGRLVQAVAAHQSRSEFEVLGDFGIALVPTLIALYSAFLDPSWRTLDLIEHTESVIHRTIRLRDAIAEPPHLRVHRISPVEVQVEYASQRGLCALAEGICRGVAQHYRESIAISQPLCMHRGDATCRLVVSQA
ncbi:MAG TPA: heme NO-binding domain-containing protein [Polyangia bacterium]